MVHLDRNRYNPLPHCVFYYSWPSNHRHTATPGGSSTSASATTPSDKLRLLAASASTYSPSTTPTKPAAPNANVPSYTPSSSPKMPTPEMVMHQQALPQAVYMTQPTHPGYYYPPQAYGYYPQQAYAMQQQQHAHHNLINPIQGQPRSMGGYSTVASYQPGPAQGRNPGMIPQQHTGVPPVAGETGHAATAPVSTNATPAASNASPNTTAASAPASAATTTASTPASAATPATSVTPVTASATTATTAADHASPASTTSASAEASKDSLSVPKDSRSSLTSSGETPTLQPPIRKAKGSTAAATVATGASTAAPTAATKETEKPKTETAPAKATAATAKPTTENGSKPAEQAKTQESKPAEVAKPTAADIVKASNAKAAAAAAAAAAPKPVSLTESLDINFEVDEAVSKKPVAASSAKATTATTPVESKPAAAVVAESKPAAAAAAAAAPVAAEKPVVAEPTKTAEKPAEKPVEKVAEPTTTTTTTTTKPVVVEKPSESKPFDKSLLPAFLQATPEPAARTPSPTPVTPVPYKVTMEDQQAAKKNEGASVPPGIRVYSAEMLMGFAAFAKGATPPPNLQIALDRARVNSPARGPGGKGAGGAGGKGRGGRADKSKGPPPTPVRPVGIDPNSIEAKARTFRGILNKITPETFEKLVVKLLEVPIENPETLASLVDIIVDIAVRELKFSAMYANLCSRVAIAYKFEQVAEDGTAYSISFRSVILNKCQGLFSERKAVQSVPAELTDPEQRQEFEIRENKQRQHLIGLVKFVAELANQSVLSMNIVPQILDQLWAAPLGYEDLELFAMVLGTSGKQLPSCKVFLSKCREWIKEFIERNEQDAEGNRIRYLLQNVTDLADSNWVHRQASAAAQGPKTLDEIRDDITKREKMLENELKNMKRNPVSGGGGRLAQPVPTKAGGRGPFSVMQRDAPRTPSSPQGGRGKASFTAQSGSNGAFSPARGSSSSNATPANSVTSPHTLSNAFDSLMIGESSDPNFLTASSSSAPRGDDSEVESARGTAEGDMDPEALDEALEEFLDSAVPEDAVETIADGPAVDESCAYFISNLLMKVFDTTPDKKRDEWAVNLLKLFVKNTDYGLSDTDRTVVPGLTQAVEQLDSLDSPLAPGRLGTIIGECLNHKIILPNAINKILAPLAGEEQVKRAMQVIVSMWKRVTPTEVSAMIKASGFNISTWNIPDSELPESMKQQMETADGLLKRGVDILEVVVWAKKAGSPALRDARFIEKVIARLSDETRAAAAAKTPIDEAKFAPAISAILSASNKEIQRQIATLVITGFASKPGAGVPLFTLLTNNGLPKQAIIDAADKKGDNYLFDPQFTSWGYSGAAAAATATTSSKGGKGGKGKGKKKG